MDDPLAEMSSAKVDLAERPISLLPAESQYAPREPLTYNLNVRSCDSDSSIVESSLFL